MSRVTKQTLIKSQIELTVELSAEEFKPYLAKGAESISRDLKIEGFRPGKAPYDVVKTKVGEMAVLEEAARIAVNKTISQAITENVEGQPVGHPQISITKLAPGNPLIYKVVLAMLPKVSLGDYKNVKVKQGEVKVEEKEVEKTIDHLREMQAKEVVADREIKEGDKALVDMEMFLDKVPVEGGQSKGVVIIIGKNYIVPGFDQQLIGAKKGDSREFKLPYPKDFHMANLAGKMVEFKVKINEVYDRQLPAADDKFASALGSKSIDELKKRIQDNMEAEQKHKQEHKAEIEMLEKIVEKSKFEDIPESLINQELETMMHELEHDIEHQGAKFNDYLSSVNKTRDQLALDLTPGAVRRIKSALSIREIAMAEKIIVNEDEVEKRVQELLTQYKGYEKVESRIKESSYKDYLRNVMTNEKVMEKLKEWNIK